MVTKPDVFCVFWLTKPFFIFQIVLTGNKTLVSCQWPRQKYDHADCRFCATSLQSLITYVYHMWLSFIFANGCITFDCTADHNPIYICRGTRLLKLYRSKGWISDRGYSTYHASLIRAVTQQYHSRAHGSDRNFRSSRVNLRSVSPALTNRS